MTLVVELDLTTATLLGSLSGRLGAEEVTREEAEFLHLPESLVFFLELSDHSFLTLNQKLALRE